MPTSSDYQPIIVDDIWKRYKLGSDNALVRLVKRFRPSAIDPRVVGDFWALKGISFQVQPGQALGVVGKNGAGKSTLLKVLCGVTRPTKGSFQLSGRVAPLIEVGAGFHPELTGRENVFLNASIMGMSRRETRAKFDQIVEFSGLAEFIDTPVKRYSSGMQARLGFAISVFVEPHVLLVDEVLSVGDLAFVLKSYRRVEEIRKLGVPVLLVSHNLQLIRNFCTHAIWLEKGELKQYGTPRDVCAAYMKSVFETVGDTEFQPSDEVYRVHSDPSVSIDAVRFVNSEGAESRSFETGEPFVVEIQYSATRPTDELIFYVTVWQEESGQMIINQNNRDDGVVCGGLTAAGTATMRMRLPQMPFVAGLHRVSVSLSEKHVSAVCDWHEKMYAFRVAGGRVGYGAFNAFPEWRGTPESP
jgi:lipopolysaccharide transport system ATP-binding protein